MGTTPSGYPYPEPSDFVADGADAIRALAEAIDAKLPVAVASGNGTMSGASGTTAQTVTLPAGLFTAAPVVVAGARTAFPENRSAVSATAATATSFIAYIYYASTADLGYAWTAVQSSTPVALLAAGAPGDHETANVTCPTAGCPNRGVTLDVVVSFTDETGQEQTVDSIACGICGADLTESAVSL